MAYRVDLTERAARDLQHIYASINGDDSEQAKHWFNGLEDAVFSLVEHPARGETISEYNDLRQLLYGRKGYRYRIIYTMDADNRVVTVIHIRHGSRAPFNPNDPDDE